MAILLVYGEDHSPITLIAHTHEGKTWISIVDTPLQRADPHLESAIRQALKLPENFTLAAKVGVMRPDFKTVDPGK